MICTPSTYCVFKPLFAFKWLITFLGKQLQLHLTSQLNLLKLSNTKTSSIYWRKTPRQNECPGYDKNPEKGVVLSPTTWCSSY